MLYCSLFIVSLLIPFPSVQHFIWPLHWCLLADICNHTYIPECGSENELDVYSRRLFIDECDLYEYNCDYEADYYPINYSDCFNIPPSPCPTFAPCPSIPTCPDHRFHRMGQKYNFIPSRRMAPKPTTTKYSLPIQMLKGKRRYSPTGRKKKRKTTRPLTKVITFMLYSFTKNHYIAPLHSCLLAKICNHIGIEICGLEKDHQDIRLFLDDCDMLEYNCDYKKAYIEADTKLCKENTIESNTQNSTISITAVEESTSVHYSSQATTKHTTSPTSLQTTITQTQPKNETITIAIESTTSETTTAKCTCMDLKTISMSDSKFTITSNQTKHECPCTDSKSSSRTTIDITTETTSIASLTTSVLRASEPPNVTELITKSTDVNISRIPLATECTRGKHNTTSITASERQISDSSIKSSETIYKSTETSSPDVETHTPTTPVHSETKESTTPPITKTTQINSDTVSTLAETEKMCTCKSITVKTNETITTQTQPVSEIISIPAKPMTPVSETTTAKLKTASVSNTELTTSLPQPKHQCTCTTSQTSTIKTKNDETTQNPLNKNDSSEITLTTVEYEEVDTTSEHNSCDKYPKHCKRPQTWETTARGETRDFLQILRERFGDRVKILKDTTHWPRRIIKYIENENDAFNFGEHNET